jgi:hypothetical protein
LNVSSGRSSTKEYVSAGSVVDIVAAHLNLASAEIGCLL